jgi:hypothetical protein
MESEIYPWVDEQGEQEGEDTFESGIGGIIARLLLLVLLFWVLIQMVLPRRILILQVDLPPNPPAEPIEPITGTDQFNLPTEIA